MKKIILEEKYILEYIRDIISDARIGSSVVNNAKYHHNTDYQDAPSVCRYGILSMLDLKKFGIKDYSEEILKLMNDIESHINGNYGVSLAVVGLTDLYPNEDEYDPYIPTKVDFLVSSNLNAYRSSERYGNEFISSKSIGVDQIRSIDIRILKLLELTTQRSHLNIYSIQKTIEEYNCIKDIALAMKETQLDIPLREMSYQDNTTLDIDRLSDIPKLILKK